MSGVLHGVIASLAGRVTDTFWKYVTLLLNTTSTNGAQNNTFLDSSTNNFSITRNGDTTQGSFNPYMPSGYWSGFFDGTGDYLGCGSQTAYAVGTGVFTVEAFVYVTTLTTESNICSTRGSLGTVNGWSFAVNNSGGISFYSNNFIFNTSNQIPVNTWVHVAIVREGTGTNQTKLYINGTNTNSATNSQDFTNTTLAVGCANDGSQNPMTGYISNFRLVKGTAVYTANFTPPTAPLTAITNTSLLCLQDNRFKDNSTNAFAITRNGDTRISKFAPFNPPASYSTASYGGSGYFDGTGDFLALPNNAAFTIGTGQVTIEAWIYCASLTQPYQGIVSGRVETPSNFPGLGLVIDNSKLQFTIMNVTDALTDPDNVPTNQWVHVVGVRNSSNNTALFVNGARKVYNASNTANGTGADMVVGRFYTGTNNYYFSGYIASVRIVKGSAVYDPTQTTLTVPTAPLTAITNTSLLLNFTNAGIYDAATINDGQTVGNAQVSTTQAKWGTTSMGFDGTGDYVTVIDKPELRLGSGDFTIEGWVYLNATGVAYGLVSKGAGTTGWSVNVTSGNKLQFSYASSNLTGATSLASGTWYYFAVVRSGTASGNLKVWLNGSTDATSAGAVNDNFNQTNVLYVGADRTAGAVLNGYLQDVRITNGYARTISTPTAAFPTL